VVVGGRGSGLSGRAGCCNDWAPARDVRPLPEFGNNPGPVQHQPVVRAMILRLPVLAAHAVAFAVQIEWVGWEHADRTLNVLGSIA
jgi:hypothetical protein